MGKGERKKAKKKKKEARYLIIPRSLKVHNVHFYHSGEPVDFRTLNELTITRPKTPEPRRSGTNSWLEYEVLYTVALEAETL